MKAATWFIVIVEAFILGCLIALALNEPSLPASGTGSNPCYVAKQCSGEKN